MAELDAAGSALVQRGVRMLLAVSGRERIAASILRAAVISGMSGQGSNSDITEWCTIREESEGNVLGEP